MSDKLFQTVKNHLDITWDDDSTNAKITDIIGLAANRICQYAGEQIEFSFTEDGLIASDEADLFLALCRYIYNGCSMKDFEDNYLTDILNIRNKHRIQRELADAEQKAVI